MLTSFSTTYYTLNEIIHILPNNVHFPDMKKPQQKNEYQTIFIVYSSKGQQKMYKSVQKDANIWKPLCQPLKPSYIWGREYLG